MVTWRKKTNLQFTRFFKLVHVTLTLERTTGCQKDIFMVTVHVLRPSGKPGDGVVVNNFLPVSGHVWDRNGRIFTDVDGDVLRSNAILGRK